ncbi:hypothetical protein M0R45_009665 [Rubus argutus]|uniref:Uncharacterized protein n=1 Tax=Rubus argutus TaxID=59490 RepID=A0AAW1Y6R2_RUBAR
MFCYCILEKSHNHVKARSRGLLWTEIFVSDPTSRSCGQNIVVMSVSDGLYSGKMVVRFKLSRQGGRVGVTGRMLWGAEAFGGFP